MSFSLPEYYLITVALHAAVLSVAVFLSIVFVRKPQRVAITALCGTLAVAILPWISAMRSQRPSVPHEAGISGISAMTSPPQWTVIHIPIEEGTLPASPAFAEPIAKPEVNPEVLAVGIWKLGSAVVLVSLLMAAGKVLRWRRSLAEPDDVARKALREAEPHLPPRCLVRISMVDGSPCVAGFFKPVVVIPALLLDPSKRRELRWALRHELRHWKGSDSRWTVVLEGIRVSQWWNPFIHILISRWKMAREHICDLSASDDDRATYGEFLISMAAKPATRNPLAVTMVRRQRLHSLKARILTVLSAAPGTVTKLEKRVLFSACLVFTGAALMISCVRIGTTRRDSATSASSSGNAPVEQVAPALAKAGPPKGSKAGFTAQVKIQTKVIFAHSPGVQGGSVHTDAQMQALLRGYAQKKGTSLMTMPAITVRTGEMASLEIIREHPDDPPWTGSLKNPGLRPNRFAGWNIRLAPTYDAGQVRLRAEVGYGFVPGAHYSPHSKAISIMEEDDKIAWRKLVRKDAAGHGKLNVGDTLAIDLGEVEPGSFGTIFFTTIPIDATGRDLDSFEKALRRSPVAVKEKLKLRGIVLEREFFEEFPAGYSGGIPNTSMALSKKSWEDMKKKLGVKPAPVVELDGDEPVTIAGEDQVAFTGKIYQTEDGMVPTLQCWPNNRKKTYPDRGQSFSLGGSMDTVSVIELKPLKPGMVRLLFLEVESGER